MKRILVTTALLALSTVSTLAADMAPRPYTKAPMIDPGYNWSGLYVGGDVGYQTSGLGLADPRQGLLTYDPKHDGFAGGGHIGYQHQWNRVVLGIEADYIGATGSTSFATPAVNIFSLGGLGTASTRLKDLWSVGGRVGVAVDNWLPYVTGGYAEGRFGFNAQTLPTGLTQNFSPRFGGVYIGGGVEWAPWKDGWTVAAEYRHYYFDAKTLDVPSSGVFVEQIDFTPKADTVMGRVSYKFGPLFGAY